MVLESPSRTVAEFHYITIPKETTLRGPCTFNGPIFVSVVKVIPKSIVIDPTVVSSVNRVADISKRSSYVQVDRGQKPVLGHSDNGTLGPGSPRERTEFAMGKDPSETKRRQSQPVWPGVASVLGLEICSHKACCSIKGSIGTSQLRNSRLQSLVPLGV